MKYGLIISMLLLSSCGVDGISGKKVLYDKVIQLDRYATKAFHFVLYKDADVVLEVVSSDPYPVNAYIIPTTSTNEFIKGNKFRYIKPFEALDTFKDSMSARLGKGNYSVAVAQSDYKVKKPTKLHFKLTIQ